jgi:HEAT repeat protein
MAAEIDFQPYLQSLSTHYGQWWQLYTLTDAETKAQQKNEPQPWKTPFKFELMAQTVQCDHLGGMEGSGVEPQPKEKIERFPVLEGIRKYVKEHRQVLLVGRPGSGKSTTLARLLLEEARNVEDPPSPLKKGEPEVEVPLFKGDLGGSRGLRDSTSLIPVLVELRFLSNSTLLDRIQAFFQRHGLQLDRTQIEDLLFHQRLLLLMDGLNELPSEAARLDIAKFRQDYPKVSMIFTTRDLSLGGDFGLEKKLEMQPLTEAQMQAFVRSYVPEQAEAMLRQLKDRLREFGQTPLLLWMLCGLFRQTGQIPNNLGEVFRAFTQGYEKGLKADVPIESDRRWWSELLQELAFWMMRGVPFGEQAPAVDVEFRVAISKVEARQIFAAFLKKKEAEAEGAAQKYLDDLLRHHLIQKNGEQVEFRHQMLQEYYAAEYLLGHWDRISEFEFKRDYLNYLKWTEAIVLFVGLIDNEGLALQITIFTMSLDLRLGARLAGKVKPKLELTTIGIISELKTLEWLKIELLGETRNYIVIPELLKAFEYEDFDVRQSAAFALGELGSEQAIPGLLKVLEHKDYYVRQKSAEILEKLDSEKTIPGLLCGLEQGDYNVRESAAFVLGRLDSEKVIPGLLKALEHEDYYVRQSAAFALGELGSEKAIPGLINALDDTYYYVRQKVVDALGKLYSEKTMPGLLKALDDRNSYVRETAAFALGKLGSEKAIPELLKALDDRNSHVYRNVAFALGKLGSEKAIPELLKALDDIAPSVCRNAAEVLGELNSEKAIPGLLKVLEHKDSGVRKTAAFALGKLNSEKAIPGLLKVLEHKDSDVRWNAAFVLGTLGSEKAIPELLKLLEYKDPFVRQNAAFALGKLGLEQAIPELLKALANQYFCNRWNVVETLGKLGSEKAIPELLKLLEHKNSDVRWNAAFALGELGSEKAIPELLKLLEHKNSDVRWNAAFALGTLGSEQAIPELLKALDYRNPFVRQNVAFALGKLGSEQAIPELLKALDDRNSYVRETAAFTLGELGSEKAIPGLLKALEHKDSDVRKTAAEVLEKLDSEKAISGLLKALEHQENFVREIAVDILGNMKNVAVPSLLPHLATLNSTPSGKDAFRAMSIIQFNCKYYNYEITQLTQSIKLFFSYAHKDEPLRDELAKHLSLLKRQNIITDWHDRNITAGTDWAQAIDHNLNTANIILLLISADFLASDYCYDKELTRALERHNQGTARVIPIILRPCDWHSAPFGKLQALPKDAKPVTEWSNPDKAFTDIAQGIRKAVAELQQPKNAQPNPNPAQPPASIPTQITYDLRGANIGNWAENQYGTQQTTQIQPNPSQPPEPPQ